jgi:hypothetical protein
MTRAQIFVWSNARQWPRTVAIDHDYDVPLERRLPAYAECQGTGDPVCGRAMFSVHGCNGNGPSRSDYLTAIGT